VASLPNLFCWPFLLFECVEHFMKILGLMVGYDVKKIVRACEVVHSWNRWVVRSWSESKGEFKWRVKLQGTKEVVWLAREVAIQGLFMKRAIQGNKEAMGRQSNKVLVGMENEEVGAMGEKVEKRKETNF